MVKSPKTKVITYRMTPERFERLSQHLKMKNLTVTTLLDELLDGYYEKEVKPEEKNDLPKEKIATRSMHRALYYALNFQKDEIEEKLAYAEEKTRYLLEDESKSMYIILNQDNSFYVEEEISSSMREKLWNGESVILYIFEPQYIRHKDTDQKELVDHYIRSCSIFEKSDVAQFREFIESEYDLQDNDDVFEFIKGLTIEEILEKLKEFEDYYPNTRAYSDIFDEISSEFENYGVDNRIEAALSEIDQIKDHLDQYRIIQPF